MKVLVIDDTKRHRVSAAQIFTGPEYELTIASSYDEAVKLLEVEYSGGGIDKNGFAIKKKELPYWDAVLCDLLMPASGECCASCSLVGVEMPVGWSLALVAARRGAKFVAVVTDKDHHQHPASAMLDRLCEHVLNVDGARMLLTNNLGSGVGIRGTKSVCPRCNGSKRCGCENGRAGYECYDCQPDGYYKERGKDWGLALKLLQG